MSNESFSVKRILDLQRAVGILNSRDMLTKMAGMDLTDDVRELVVLGLANVETTEALEKRIAEHQAAYNATLPVQPFQTYEAVYSGDGDPEPEINYGIYEAHTASGAVALAHVAGETDVTNARPLTNSELMLHVAKQQGMTVVELPMVKMENADMLGLPTAEK
jgi:hypothetical protein